jgi:CheY-like chemotaxis protein
LNANTFRVKLLAMMQKHVQLVLVEDEETDVIHFQRIARRVGLDVPVAVARDGFSALKFLNDAPGGSTPVVVTDLNMPGLSGHELIDEIRAAPDLAATVVFVLTTSDVPEDIERAYHRGVAGYIVKEPTGQSIEESIRMLKHYFNAVQLPA